MIPRGVTAMIIAVFLGWIFLKETEDACIILAGFMVLSAVGLIRAGYKKREPLEI